MKFELPEQKNWFMSWSFPFAGVTWMPWGTLITPPISDTWKAAAWTGCTLQGACLIPWVKDR